MLNSISVIYMWCTNKYYHKQTIATTQERYLYAPTDPKVNISAPSGILAHTCFIGGG